jgi:hypothetical protein
VGLRLLRLRRIGARTGLARQEGCGEECRAALLIFSRGGKITIFICTTLFDTRLNILWYSYFTTKSLIMQKMNLTAQNIERIIAFGGGISLDATKYEQNNLERFAAFASNSGVTITLKKCDEILPVLLERIAAFGKGRVIFEFNE